MSARDTTLATRAPIDLRTDLEAIAARRAGRGETRPDGSHGGRPRPIVLADVIREALREYADRELARGGEAGRRPRLTDIPPAARSSDPATSKAAALKVAPRVGSQRRRALEAFVAAGDRGLTADEVVVALAPAPHNSTARRVTDLLQAGAIRERTADTAAERAALDPAEDRLVDDHAREASPVTRLTRAGSAAHVYVATELGRRWLTDNRSERTAA